HAGEVQGLQYRVGPLRVRDAGGEGAGKASRRRLRSRDFGPGGRPGLEPGAEHRPDGAAARHGTDLDLPGPAAEFSRSCGALAPSALTHSPDSYQLPCSPSEVLTPRSRLEKTTTPAEGSIPSAGVASCARPLRTSAGYGDPRRGRAGISSCRGDQ